jgi:hypothetical protein
MNNLSVHLSQSQLKHPHDSAWWIRVVNFELPALIYAELYDYCRTCIFIMIVGHDGRLRFHMQTKFFLKSYLFLLSDFSEPETFCNAKNLKLIGL